MTFKPRILPYRATILFFLTRAFLRDVGLAPLESPNSLQTLPHVRE
jgi:hypothetical protein